MDLYICTTYYHVYALLLKRLTGFQQACDVVVCKDIPTGEQLRERLAESGLFGNVWFVDQWALPEDRGKDRLDRIFTQHKRRYNTIKEMLPFDVKQYDNIFIFHDGTSLGRYLNDAKVKYHLIEDSYNFYQHMRQTPQAVHIREKNYKYGLAKLLDVGYFPLGESKHVIDVEVNENKSLQISKKRIVEISRDAMRKALTPQDKQIIRTIFGNPCLPTMGGNVAILLTESFAFDGHCSREKQYAMYEYIVRDLKSKGMDVIIKPHPRDDLDYSELGMEVMDRAFPMEILEDNFDGEINCLATVSSSAVMSIKAKTIYKYDYLLNGGESNE